MLDKIALEISVWQRCRPLQLALTAHQLLRRREGVRILGHTRWSPRNASVALEFGDIHSLAAAAVVTSKLLPERGLDVAPPQQQHQLPLGPGPPQPVRTLPGLLTALAASLDGLWPNNVMTLHMSWTDQEVIAAEARLFESVHCEAARFSFKAEQLRQRTSPAMRSPLVHRRPSGGREKWCTLCRCRLCSGLLPYAGYHTEVPWVFRVVCHVFALDALYLGH